MKSVPQTWYVDNNNNPHLDFVNSFVENVENASSIEDAEEKVRAIEASYSLQRPATVISCARDFGIFTKSELGDSTKLYSKKIISFKELIFELMIKRNEYKLQKTKIKPLVLLCKFFEILTRMTDIVSEEKFLTAYECYKYLCILENYEECTPDYVRQVIADRTYGEGASIPRLGHFPNEVYLNIWFNSLVDTGLFCCKERKTIICLNENAEDIVSFISREGDKISNAPVKENRAQNETWYNYFGTISNGFLEIVPEIEFKQELEPEDTRGAFEFLFGIGHRSSFDSDKYFDKTNYALYKQLFLVRNLALIKICASNRKSAELLLDYSKGANYNIITKGGKSMILPFSDTEHTEMDKLITEGDVCQTEGTEIFAGFSPWLTSHNNPDYTGKEKYAGYAKALPKLIKFMYDKGLIEDENLNDKNPDKYKEWVEVYNGSDEAKEYDDKKLSAKAGIAALKKYIKYIEYLIAPHPVDFDYSTTKGDAINKIFYGVPGCGKSHHIQHTVLKGYEKENVIRTTFYQDYSNTDFVGQILPKIVKGENGDRDTVEYSFNPGSFTLALIQAISNPDKKVALVVEEINRGNAPAIFGDIFQLLDRGDDGISEYGVVNVGMMDYLNAHEFEVNGEKKRYAFGEIKIPGNMDIFATMNTSDQNVYTLDTAFTRRWAKERIPNSFNGNELEKWLVPGMDKYTWGEFVAAINAQIQNKLDDLQVNEDKQVGAFFVKKADLLAADHTLSDEDKKAKAISFAHKVLEYLWDDVSKLDHSVIFNPVYKTFEKVVEDYLKVGAAIFNSEIFKN